MKPFARIWPYARRYRVTIVAGLGLVLLSNAFGVVAPWLLGQAIDAVGAADVGPRVIATYAALIVATALLGGAGRFGMRRLLNGVSRRIETDLRDDLFAHLVRLDAGFFDRTRTGDLMSRSTNDTQAVRMAIGPGIMYLTNTVTMSVFALTLMARSSVRLTLIALIPLALLPPLMLRFGRVIHDQFQRIQDQFGVLSTMVQENLAGVRIVRAYGQQQAQEREFGDLNAEYLDRNMALARTSAIFRPALTVVAGLGTLVVFAYGGLEVVAGRMSEGEFVAFFFYLALMAWPMIALGWVVNLFQRGAASMGRIEEIFGVVPAIRDPEPQLGATAAGDGALALAGSSAERPVRGDIAFRNVRFRYPGTDRDVLSDVTFEVPAGQTTAIVGPTGSGKSTLVALLARRYDPSEGAVLLDGAPLSSMPLARLRSAIAVVPQDAFVFSDTIRHNIAYGSPERVEWAARTARIAETIEAFPAGYDTRLGERGVNLSGGQRQRTTLARALARDARVLVLDDALSAVDTHTEADILAALRGVLRDRTALIVSHRLTAVKDADQILVLDDGVIVESGRHADLLARGGLYARLLERQLLEDELAASDAQHVPLAPSST